MAIFNSATLKALNTSLKAIFNNAFAGVDTQWQKIAMVVPSNKGSNTYAWLGMITKFREWIGDRVIQNLKTYDYAIKNKTWEDTLGVNKEDIEDDDIGIYNPIIANLGHDAKVHPDKLVFGLLKEGKNTKCYDGQNFFDTDHPVLVKDEETSVSNYFAGSNAPWFLTDNSRPVKPIIFQERKKPEFVALDNPEDPNVFFKKQIIYGVDGRYNVGFALWQLAFCSEKELNKTNFMEVYKAMCSLKGDNGDALGIKPTTLWVSPENLDKALELIEADKINGTSNTCKGIVKVEVCPYLS